MYRFAHFYPLQRTVGHRKHKHMYVFQGYLPDAILFAAFDFDNV